MATQHNNDRAAWLQGPAAECNLPDPIKNPFRLVLLGAPGVGKGTQADLLHQKLHACHLSTGDVFRAASKSTCELSPAMQEATSYMRRGALVPDATVWEMVRERSGCLHCGGGFILDGFPRTLAQAESLKTLLEEEAILLTAVVDYELPESEIVARLSGRGTCTQCRTVFHVVDRPPKTEGVCDRCGSSLFQREDDRPESIKVRLAAYRESTEPLINFYRELGLLLTVDANGSPDEIFARTITSLEHRRLSKTQAAASL
jgi:adenylate kinase